jgi:drug/metabolite transporter (DMT)-like permease
VARSPITNSAPRRARLAYLAFALLALIGGFTFVLIKASIETIEPTVVVLILNASAAATLGMIFAVLRRNPVPRGTGSRFPGYLLIAVANIIPFMAFGWGEQYISSGLTAILIATSPLWTAIFAYWVTPNERPGRVRYAGVAVGFCGIGVLVAPQLADGPLRVDALASLAVLAGAGSIAVATLGQRRLLASVHPLDTSLWQWVLCTLIMLPIAAPSVRDMHPSVPSLAAAVTVGAVCSGLASVLYYFILNNLGATRGSTVIFLIPITAVLWGTVLFHEPLTIFMMAGMAVVLVGLLLTMIKQSAARAILREEPGTATL